MTETIKEILMRRDGMTEAEALDLIQQAKEDLYERIMHPQDYDDQFGVCADWFGLEPDYLDELLDMGI